MRLLGEHALLQQTLADKPRARDFRINLGADPEALAAHCLQRRTVYSTQACEHVRAEPAATLDKVLVGDDAKRFEADRRGERIAAEGRAMRTRREDVH